MKETEKMETSLVTPVYKATNSFGGIAKSVLKARHTAGRLGQTTQLADVWQGGIRMPLLCWKRSV